MLENSLSAPYLQKECTRWDMDKNLLDYGVLDPISKVTLDLRILDAVHRVFP